jgi:hypothetical protein
VAAGAGSVSGRCPVPRISFNLARSAAMPPPRSSCCPRGGRRFLANTEQAPAAPNRTIPMTEISSIIPLIGLICPAHTPVRRAGIRSRSSGAVRVHRSHGRGPAEKAFSLQGVRVPRKRGQASVSLRRHTCLPVLPARIEDLPRDVHAAPDLPALQSALPVSSPRLSTRGGSLTCFSSNISAACRSGLSALRPSSSRVSRTGVPGGHEHPAKPPHYQHTRCRQALEHNSLIPFPYFAVIAI